MATAIQSVVMFDEPILVSLPGYPLPHRVHGVEFARCPNGIRGRFAYAIADWSFSDSDHRHEVCDLKTKMRLANAVAGEHPFGMNAAKWVK